MIHSQENACNLQIRIKSVLNIFHHFQYIRNSFTCKEMCLHWNNAIIGSGECVDGQKLVFQSAVNNNVVILFAERNQQLLHYLLTKGIGETGGIILRKLHDL